MSSLYQPPYELPDEVDLDPPQLEVLRSIYHEQPLILDHLHYTRQAEWVHGSFIARTGLLLSLHAMMEILDRERKNGRLGTKTDRAPRPRNGDK